MKIVLDLCSGSGSATGIWENHGYDVYRYDIVTTERSDTYLTDLSNLEECRAIIKRHQHDDIVLIWASPPCTEYSFANRNTNDPLFVPDTRIWRNCQGIIDHLKPDHHIIENVKGAVRTWGKPRQYFGAYYFWGNFPKFSVPEKIPPKGVRGLGHNGSKGYDPTIRDMSKEKRARYVAKIPYAITMGLFRAITLQEKLFTP